VAQVDQWDLTTEVKSFMRQTQVEGKEKTTMSGIRVNLTKEGTVEADRHGFFGDLKDHIHAERIDERPTDHGTEIYVTDHDGRTYFLERRHIHSTEEEK